MPRHSGNAGVPTSRDAGGSDNVYSHALLMPKRTQAALALAELNAGRWKGRGGYVPGTRARFSFQALVHLFGAA